MNFELKRRKFTSLLLFSLLTLMMISNFLMGYFLLIISVLSFLEFSNILRMYIVILSGHYYGLDTMLFVHNNAGWILFTFWLFLFWFARFLSHKDHF